MNCIPAANKKYLHPQPSDSSISMLTTCSSAFRVIDLILRFYFDYLYHLKRTPFLIEFFQLSCYISPGTRNNLMITVDNSIKNAVPGSGQGMVPRLSGQFLSQPGVFF